MFLFLSVYCYVQQINIYGNYMNDKIYNSHERKIDALTNETWDLAETEWENSFLVSVDL